MALVFQIFKTGRYTVKTKLQALKLRIGKKEK